MNCREYLALHSEYVDGELEGREAARMEAHEASCPTCTRYDRVVRSGIRLVRGLPEVEPSSDFFPRLQHRLYNLEELRAGNRSAGVGAMLSLAVAGALAVLAWSPLLRLGLGIDGSTSTAERAVTDASAGDRVAAARAPGAWRALVPPPGGVVHLAAEADGLPRIDPRSVAWGAESVFGPAAGEPEHWWRTGVAVSGGVPATRRVMRTVDYRIPGPYSPLVIEAPAFRRATIPTRTEVGRLGRD